MASISHRADGLQSINPHVAQALRYLGYTCRLCRHEAHVSRRPREVFRASLPFARASPKCSKFKAARPTILSLFSLRVILVPNSDLAYSIALWIDSDPVPVLPSHPCTPRSLINILVRPRLPNGGNGNRPLQRRLSKHKSYSKFGMLVDRVTRRLFPPYSTTCMVVPSYYGCEGLEDSGELRLGQFSSKLK